MRQPNLCRISTYLLLGLGMASCSFAPDVPSSNMGPKDDTWPALLTAEQLSALTTEPDVRPTNVDEESRILAARSAALRARAAGIRSSVLTQAERQRLNDATATP